MDKVDVVIIGSGIAGISSAYYLQKNFPDLTYKVIEARSDLGGLGTKWFFLGSVQIPTCIPMDSHLIHGKVP